MKTIEEKIKTVLKSKATISEWKNNFDSKEYKEASELNKALFGIHLNRIKNCDCVNDLMNYIFHLSDSKINQIKKSMESKFKLKKGKLIMLHGIEMQISEANLTDEKALMLLKKFPSHINSFEVYPENWQELILDKKPKKAQVIEEVAPDKDEEIATEKIIEEKKEFKPRSTGRKKRK